MINYCTLLTVAVAKPLEVRTKRKQAFVIDRHHIHIHITHFETNKNLWLNRNKQAGKCNLFNKVNKTIY